MSVFGDHLKDDIFSYVRGWIHEYGFKRTFTAVLEVLAYVSKQIP